jgi:hypothetical protein
MNIDNQIDLCENCKIKNKNITSENNTFIYFMDGDQYTISIPEGFYAIEDLNKEVHKQMQENKHNVGIHTILNLNTSHCILKINKNYAVQFGNKSRTFHKILGFVEGIYSDNDVSYNSQNKINITGK